MYPDFELGGQVEHTTQKVWISTSRRLMNVQLESSKQTYRRRP